jgi:hypothetical protein
MKFENENNKEWEQVGGIGVDAGLCWIGDPCYCVTPDADSHPAKTWSEFCEKIRDMEHSQQFNYPLGHPGLGVCVSTGWGDGFYPVYVRLNEDGRVAEARVVFIDEEDEDLDDED